MTADTRRAYIGRNRYGDRWRLQLTGFDHGDVSDIYAEVDVPADDSTTLALAEEFLEAICASKDLELRARRGNDVG